MICFGRKKLITAALTSGFVVLILFVFIGLQGEPSIVALEFSGYKNKDVAILRICNLSGPSIRINEYYTLYWVNSDNIKTNVFLRHNKGYATIPPRASVDISVALPKDAQSWRASLSCLTKRNRMQNFFYKACEYFGLNLMNDEGDYKVMISPEVTNTN